MLSDHYFFEFILLKQPWNTHAGNLERLDMALLDTYSSGSFKSTGIRKGK